MVGFTQNVTHPTRCQNANMLVNATHEAFKSAAVHGGHVDIEQPLTNSSHGFLFFILISHLLQLTAMTSFSGSLFGLQHFYREIPFMTTQN